MRQKLVVYIAVLSILLPMGILGCSSGESPAVPGEPAMIPDAGGQPAPASVREADSGHHALVSGTLYLNNETQEVTNVVSRTAFAHYDGKPFVIPPLCWEYNSCMSFTDAYVDNITEVDVDWHIKIRLKNPTDLGLYSVRFIILPYSPYPEFVRPQNPDGWTKVHGGGAETPNPFFDFPASWADKRYWPAHYANATWVHLRVPKPWGVNEMYGIPYVVDVSWPGPMKESPGLFDQFVKQSDLPEHHWYASDIFGDIDIPVWDWQADIAAVRVDCTPIHPSLGVMEADFHSSEYNNYLHHYYLHLDYSAATGGPAQEGTYLLDVEVEDSVSPWIDYDKIPITITFDTDPPISVDDGGAYKGLIDRLNGDSHIRFYFDRAEDPSDVIYVFYYNKIKNAWDGDNPISTSEWYPIDMNWPPFYPACYLNIAWTNFDGNWWSVDAWDGPNNKAHTEVQKWCQPWAPVERWKRLSGLPGQQNTIWGSTILIDMDNDNDDDALCANRMASVFCYDGIGGGSPAGLKWVFDTHQSAIYSSPAAADVTGDGIPEIFVTTNGVEEGAVFCINGATGFEQWSVVTLDIIDSSPCLTDLNGGGYDVVAGDNSGNLYALDGTDGSLIWASPFHAGGGIGSSPAADDVNYDDIPDIAFGAYDGHVYMVNGATGALIWKYNCGTGLFNVESSPALYDADGDGVNDVAVGADDTVFCFKGQGIGGGQTYAIWSKELVANFRGSPAVGDCNLDGVPDIVITGRQGAQYDLFIVDGANGDGIWGVAMPGGGNIFTSPALADVSADGHLNAIFGANDPFMADTERYYIVNVDRLEYGVLLVHAYQCLTPNNSLGMPGCPSLGDVNNDGRWDMAFGSVQGRIFVHNFDTLIPEDPALRPWVSFHGNYLRNGMTDED